MPRNALDSAAEYLDCFLTGSHHGAVGDLLEPEAQQQPARAARDAGILAGYLEKKFDNVVEGELCAVFAKASDDCLQFFNTGTGNVAKDQLFLREIVEESRSRDSNCVADHLYRDALIPVGREEFESDSHNLGSSVMLLLLPQRRCTASHKVDYSP